MRTIGKELSNLLCLLYEYKTQHIPSQLVFGRDAILNTNQEANWQLIKQSKQVLINKGNLKENNQEANWQLIKQCKQALINKVNQKQKRRRQSHVYRTRDKVLLKIAWKTNI